MSFTLYTGNKLNVLADILATNLRSPQNKISIFEKQTVVVQSRGMAQWVNYMIAEKNGISTNIDFPFPKNFIYRNIFGIRGYSVNEIPFMPEIMTWQIIDVLPKLLKEEKELFSELQNYIGGSNSINLKTLQIAEKIAGIFDQYLTFRPSGIMEWDNADSAKNKTTPKEFRKKTWQKRLWQEISKNYPNPHLPALVAKMSNLNASNIPKKISLFGFSSMPPLHFEIFAKLSEITNIDFYYLNPTRSFVEDNFSEKETLRAQEKDNALYMDTQNQLLASLGKQGRDFFSEIIRAGYSATKFHEQECFVDIVPENLLKSIQGDILELKEPRRIDPNGEKDEQKDGDKSIQIHCCHSRMREIEILYNNLLNMFDESENKLMPKDIIVMTPDIQAYTPYIEAIFKSRRYNSRYIYSTIADRGYTEENQEAIAFLQILKLMNSRFKVNDVIDIFETESVYRKFDFSESDLETLRDWLSENHINWGIDEDFLKQKLSECEYFSENSWNDGLKRMLLGYAMKQNKKNPIYDNKNSHTLPYDKIEGGSAILLGNFAEYAKRLFKFQKQCSLERTPESWQGLMQEILSSFFLETKESAEGINIVSKSITAAISHIMRADFSKNCNIEVISAFLEKNMQEKSSHAGFLRGGVTFCKLLPMRSIPAKVICIIGMNDGEFPRQAQKLSFDLINQFPQKGDRNVREDDKNIFLESILSAQEKLYISYIGKDIKDNTKIPPAVALSELCDYIEANYKLKNEKENPILDQIIVEHPLQPFSLQYFNQTNKKLFSYSQTDLTAAEKNIKKRNKIDSLYNKPRLYISERLSEPSEEFLKVSDKSLYSFFKNPCAYLLRHRLDLNYKLWEEIELQDRERFSITPGLDSYKIDNMILEKIIETGKPSDSIKRDILTFMTASGELPVGEWGKSVFNEQYTDVAEYANKIYSEHSIKTEAISEEVMLEPFSLNFQLDNLFLDDAQIVCKYAKDTPKYLLEAWIKHLILNTLEYEKLPKKTILYLKKEKTYIFNEISIYKAKENLSLLLNFYWKGLKAPLPFFPKTSMEYARKLKRTNSDEKAMESAISKWTTTKSFYANNEDLDPAFFACFAGELPETEEFRQIGRDIFQPILENIAGGF
ncbi:MAG: exodeoxyribonuclease V subunit gamma [Verrucomicrobiota bacterium]|nr:exodeoxyribonuclease V subunit gamma [Verrucomicrobiota bacterium]